MKLVPLQGVDSIRFGDSISTVIEVWGTPKEKLKNKQGETHQLYYGDISFGFYDQGRLDFIAVTPSGQEVALWDLDPFALAKSTTSPFEAIKDWLNLRGCESIIEHSSFGGTLSVDSIGLTFCFPLPDWEVLEGIQLCIPQGHIKSQ